MKVLSKVEISTKPNLGVVAYLDELSQGQGEVHPDVATRMEELTSNLPDMSLAGYERSLIVTHNSSLSIVAVAYGTAYSIKVGSQLSVATNVGAKTAHRWSDGTTLDLAKSFGTGWVVGNWEKDEFNWIHLGNE